MENAIIKKSINADMNNPQFNVAAPFSAASAKVLYLFHQGL